MKALIRKAGTLAVSQVDFEAMNRVPPPLSLREVKGEIVPGMENIWYEYVPGSCRGDAPVPLVVQLHGGGNDGRRWAGITVWHELAERRGMIVVYPNSPDFECWTCQERDIKYLYDLIGLLCGSFYVPVGELCRMLFGSFVSMADDVMCISAHWTVLGRYTARVIRNLLGGAMRPRK